MGELSGGGRRGRVGNQNKAGLNKEKRGGDPPLSSWGGERALPNLALSGKKGKRGTKENRFCQKGKKRGGGEKSANLMRRRTDARFGRKKKKKKKRGRKKGNCVPLTVKVENPRKRRRPLI